MSEGSKDWSMLDAVLATIVGSRRRVVKADVATIEDDCRALLKLGPDAGKRIARRILAAYAGFDDEERLRLFHFLNDELDLDIAQLNAAVANYSSERSPEQLQILLAASEPLRQELLRRLNTQSGATAALVDLRADLLAALANEPELRRTDLDFAHLFSSWFNRGFLELERITWDSPASVLAKIIAYEAVHEINGWSDLRSRLQPADRRCYAFFHPSMPGEPLVFTEVALVQGVPDNVQRVLDEKRDEQAAEAADTAVFYSISNCQKGLRGISFGNLLIKQVVADLGRELPNLKRFVTLSPLPGFANWLAARDEQPGIGEALQAQAAHYLAVEKRKNGQPADAVARFHLANGAELHAVHTQADTSQNGMSQSHGVMVNYLYDLARVEANQEAFAAEGSIATTRAVRTRANQYRRPNASASGTPK
ncbi:MAG: malonyl-CoA decarboxylase family protein [Pseudomonadota bacterium]